MHSTLDPFLARANLRLVNSLALVSVDLAPELGPVPDFPAQTLSNVLASDWKPTIENEIH